MPSQYLSTSRLTNVIQLISLGRQSGILRVVRGHGPAREMGQIQFVDGQPTAALLGQLTGTAALNVLANWGESYYIFDDTPIGADGGMEPAGSSLENSPYGRWPTGDAGWMGRSGQISQGLGSGPQGGTGASWPAYDPLSPLSPPPSTPPPPSYLPGPRPPAAPSMPVSGYGHTGWLPGSRPPQPGASPTQPSGIRPAVPATGVQSRGSFPRRTGRVDLSEPLPLDRRERMVLLLVDGRRNVADLARLTGRSEEEVRAVLGNLKMLGLIE
jgi:Domain of unknown function (DUF4388)